MSIAELDKIGEESAPSVDSLATEEIEASIKLVRAGLDKHNEDLSALKVVQYGILIVVAVGFVALIISIVIFFCQTTTRFNDELKLISEQNSVLRQRESQSRIDSMSARILRLEHATSSPTSP